MKRHLFLLAMIGPALAGCATGALAAPVDPLSPRNDITVTTPTLTDDGSLITDLTAVVLTCGAETFTHPTALVGTDVVVPFPPAVLAQSGTITCTGYATTLSFPDQTTAIASNAVDRWCNGLDACYAAQPAWCEPITGDCYTTQPAWCDPVDGACFDAVPPGPPALGDAGGGQVGGGTSALALAAAGLSPGQSIAITPNTGQNSHDVQWQTGSIFRDAARQRVHYLGKPATNQPGGDTYSHHIYDEASDTWSTAVAATGIGHAWTTAFDPDTGDYYFHINGSTNLMRYVAASGQWMATAAQASPSLISGGANLAAMGYHPNLFGAGQPGIFAWSIFRAFAYNPATDTWTNLSPTSFVSGTPYFNRSIGQALYLPGSDRLIMFSKNTGGFNEAVLVEAGAGASADPLAAGLLHLTGAPPLNVYGGGGVDQQGHVVTYPGAPDSLLLLEEHGTSRVWRSDDAGATWVLQAYVHPFQGMPALDAGEYTVGTLDAFGVVAAVTSNQVGGEFRIWKPGA